MVKVPRQLERLIDMIFGLVGLTSLYFLTANFKIVIPIEEEGRLKDIIIIYMWPVMPILLIIFLSDKVWRLQARIKELESN